jgi:hypothetical protein
MFEFLKKDKLMSNIIVGIIAVILVIGIYFFNKEEPKTLNTKKDNKEREMTQEQIKKLSEQILLLKDKLASLSKKNSYNEDLDELKNQIVIPINNSKEELKVIKGYSASYEYIEKNNLKPMYKESEKKILKDGTTYNIYSNTINKGYFEGITPPTTPISSSINVHGEELYIIVDSSTQQVAVLTISAQGEEELIVRELQETNTENISPPVPPNTLTQGSILPTVPDEDVSK